MPDYNRLMEDVFASNSAADPNSEDMYDGYIDGFSFKDGTPKDKLFVRLNPDITDDQR